ncbi:hypothetical protein ARAM_004268 [Aspergillus rambellii]|uniref:Zn(2)-C6 fungal-type domain-containing protein n=1 Tax=Aspergillus rambellii TaxID=308745 RepID=A0A0F8UI79_9EURO|nr:hypothetical protein ARAM_004268 [Aspergillus rambellii]
MFHTFEGFENPTTSTSARGGRERQPSIGRRVTTLRACTSCRHRKIKCDGEKPCEACRWYKKADLCHYSDPRPSRRHIEKLSATLDEYRTVLEKLFPNVTPEALVNLPRERLLELTSKGLDLAQLQLQPRPQSQTTGAHPASPATSGSIEAHVSPISNEDGNLESLQTMPEESSDTRNLSHEITNAISDDVNALSLSTRQPACYLGVSSIHAVLKVIIWLDPGSVSYFASTPPSAPCRASVTDLSSSEGPWGHDQSDSPPQVHLQVPESQLIDAYFTYVQPLTPILDEQTFRETYYSGHRKDDRWYCLLNLVLALGSICASTADDISHKIYYSRCRTYLDLESLGSSHLETVQTLGLLGGWYLHYVAQPNLAYSLMGAALRMAATMGLHKEFANQSDISNRQKMASLDLKRRVWWTLFLMDTWGGGTLGRPTMGRFGPTITVKLPHHRETGNVLDILPLLENVRFCKISNQIQDALALSPLTKYSEIIHFDNQLVEWYNSLPYILKDHEPCPESIATTRTIMRWRYHVQRILLYRPTLLSYAMRRVPYIALRSEERTAIEKCREIAETAIQEISATAKTPQMSGWNAIWFLFQSTMVPLLGLFLNDSTSTDPRAAVEACQAQVEMALLVFARLRQSSPTGKKTLDAVSRILEASKRGPSVPGENNSAGNANHQTPREIQIPPMTSGVLPSQNDAGRGIIGTNENGFTELFPISGMDDPNGQYLWDFLSWSDNNLVPMADIDNVSDTSLLSGDDRHMSTTPKHALLTRISTLQMAMIQVVIFQVMFGRQQGWRFRYVPTCPKQASASIPYKNLFLGKKTSKKTGAIMASFFQTPSLVYGSAVALRVILLFYGAWQDANSPVKYTDIDYMVFTDASRYVSHGASPYDRDTYRYTPLLAWMLLPTSWSIPGFFAFGKALFALSDVIAGWLISKSLVSNYGMTPARALKYASFWLLNPMVANISTRGSSEGLLGVLVIALLWAALNRQTTLAGILLGFGVHFKIYPFIYGVSILWWLDSEREADHPNEPKAHKHPLSTTAGAAATTTATGTGTGAASSRTGGTATKPVTESRDPEPKCSSLTPVLSPRQILAFLTPTRLQLILTSLATFAVLNLAMYRQYGTPFLQHTYFHHLTRIDHRHNFSAYSSLLYLSAAGDGHGNFESLAFIPQLLLSVLVIPMVLAKKNLPGAMLAQTFAFVTFNKVCTSQYFLWYLIFLPFYLPDSSLLRNPRLGVLAAALWVVSQAAWLQQGFNLEFLGISTFMPGLFLSSLGFFAVNVWILGIIVADIGGVPSS